MSKKAKYSSSSLEDDDNEKNAGKSCSFIRGLSVEPPALLVMISLVMSGLAFQNFLLETICRVDLGLPEEQCTEIIKKVNATFKDQERQMQQIAASTQALVFLIYSSSSILLVLFMGPLSDAIGRKVPLLASVVGFTLSTAMMAIGYMLLGHISSWTYAMLVTLPSSLSGGVPVFTMCGYSYLVDTTSRRDRTFRTGLLSAAIRFGLPIGLTGGGLFLKHGISTLHYLLICTGINAGALLLVILFVDNRRPKKQTEEMERSSTCAIYNPFCILRDLLRVLFQKRSRRGMFLLLILCYVLYAVPVTGEAKLAYLFVREQLSWDISSYSFFSTHNWAMSCLGSLISLVLCSRRVNISDPVVGLVSGLSQILSSLLYAFATSPFMMYASAAVDMMNATMAVVVRSMLSKIVAPDEVGKLFSLMGVVEGVMALIMGPTYALIYKGTMTSFAGAFYLVSAVVTVPAEMIFLYFACRRHRGEGNEEPETQPGSYKYHKNIKMAASVLVPLNGKSIPDPLNKVTTTASSKGSSTSGG